VYLDELEFRVSNAFNSSAIAGTPLFIVTRRQPRFRQEHDSAFLYFHTVSDLGHLAK
jgi:hypothetical protein